MAGVHLREKDGEGEHSERAARREEGRVCVCAQRKSLRKTDVTGERSITGSWRPDDAAPV